MDTPNFLVTLVIFFFHFVTKNKIKIFFPPKLSLWEAERSPRFSQVPKKVLEMHFNKLAFSVPALATIVFGGFSYPQVCVIFHAFSNNYLAPVIELARSDVEANNNTLVYNVASNNTLVGRAGNPRFTLYDGLSCSGNVILIDYIDNKSNCNKKSRSCGAAAGIRSVLLMQDNDKNPKPTMDFYESSDCSDRNFRHVNIGAGNSACCDMPGLSNGIANGYYAYNDCHH